jgi:hypothetical protein
MGLILNGYRYLKFKMIRTLRRTSGSFMRLKRHKTRLITCVLSAWRGTPHFRRSARTSSSLTDGLVDVIPGIGHCCHTLGPASTKSLIEKTGSYHHYIIITTRKYLAHSGISWTVNNHGKKRKKSAKISDYQDKIRTDLLRNTSRTKCFGYW